MIHKTIIIIDYNSINDIMEQIHNNIVYILDLNNIKLKYLVVSPELIIRYQSYYIDIYFTSFKYKCDNTLKVNEIVLTSSEYEFLNWSRILKINELFNSDIKE